jgi:hypothetical protein
MPSRLKNDVNRILAPWKNNRHFMVVREGLLIYTYLKYTLSLK